MASAADASAAVDAFMSTLKHPHKAAIAKFAGLKEGQLQRAALQGIARQWIKFV